MKSVAGRVSQYRPRSWPFTKTCPRPLPFMSTARLWRTVSSAGVGKEPRSHSAGCIDGGELDSHCTLLAALAFGSRKDSPRRPGRTFQPTAVRFRELLCFGGAPL